MQAITFPSAEQLVVILNGSCIPQGVATTDAGWCLDPSGFIYFDDYEGGYDFYGEIHIMGNRAQVSIDEAFRQVSSVDELVDFIQQEWMNESEQYY